MPLPSDEPAAEGQSAAYWAGLHRRFIDACAARGLDRPVPWAYVWRGALVTLSFWVAYGALLTGPEWPARLVALVGALFGSFQGGLLAHDLSHRNVTSRRWLLRGLGQYFMTLLNGQAYAAWEWQHLRHHSHTQDALGDPDMEVAFFALSPADAERKRGLYRWTTRHQHLLLWPSVCLQAFSIRAATLSYLYRNGARAWLDVLGLLGHAVLWLGVPALFLGFWAAGVNYLLVSLLLGPSLAASFLWNHVGTRVVAPGERLPYFVQRLEGSRNLRDHPVVNFLVGGLNFHVEHHLAPHVPSSRLPQTRRLLAELLAQEGIPYREWGYGEAMKDVQRHLREVAQRCAAQAPAAAGALAPSPLASLARRAREAVSRDATTAP